jgi:hypothetical protein
MLDSPPTKRRNTNEYDHINDRPEPHRECTEEEGLLWVVEHAEEDDWIEDVAEAGGWWRVIKRGEERREGERRTEGEPEREGERERRRGLEKKREGETERRRAGEREREGEKKRRRERERE